MINEAYSQILKNELARRCERNPRYSLRAFAQALDIDHGALSRILSGKQIPSLKLARKIILGLELSPEEESKLLASVERVHIRRGIRRAKSLKPDSSTPKDLQIELYRCIADWYHIAILEMTYVEHFQSDSRWIAKRLGISHLQAKLAIDRLIRVGLLEDVEGQLRKVDQHLVTTHRDITTSALRKNQRQFLEKAILSLENDPIEKRNHTTMTMAITESKLPIARELIRDFEQKLCELLESGPRERVYNLAICLYPLETKQERK